MPLITCPDCGREVSDAASACIGCGRPMEPAPASSEPLAQQGSSSVPGWAVIQGSQGELQIQQQGDPQIDLLLRQGRRIQAVKAMMDSTGLGLAEAKKRVDARALDLNV